MEIKVLGPGCSKCNKTEKIVKEAVAESGLTASVEKVTDMLQIAAHGVMAMPAVMVDGELKISGRVPGKKDVKSWLSR